MLKLLRSVLPGPKTNAAAIALPRIDHIAAPDDIVIDGLRPFRLADHLTMHEDLPIADWTAVRAWLSTTDLPNLQSSAWTACERAWLLHLRKALGNRYQLLESDSAALLSSLEAKIAKATLDYIQRTRRRILRVLDGIAQVAPWGKDLLIVFDDQESYYRYVSYYYPEAGEFALSGGMHIDAGCSHFVTRKADLSAIEPVIAHEMTHGCVAHLPLPLWLNEGIAVNTERRIAAAGAPLYTPQEMRDKHLSFWGEREIQQFWSGKSFDRTDDGNLLSYDLARIIVEQLAKDWKSFKRFVLAADRADAGACAASVAFGIDLGALACALLEQGGSPAWTPDPNAWRTNEPQRLESSVGTNSARGQG
jgi:hypothetical protein